MPQKHILYNTYISVILFFILTINTTAFYPPVKNMILLEDIWNPSGTFWSENILGRSQLYDLPSENVELVRV